MSPALERVLLLAGKAMLPAFARGRLELLAQGMRQVSGYSESLLTCRDDARDWLGAYAAGYADVSTRPALLKLAAEAMGLGGFEPRATMLRVAARLENMRDMQSEDARDACAWLAVFRGDA